MCGVTGIVALGGAPLPPDHILQAMCSTLRHRGPDDLSLDTKNGVVLGNTRLSIIDVAGGRQPLLNESGSVRTVLTSPWASVYRRTPSLAVTYPIQADSMRWRSAFAICSI